jgi:D-threo-aldose 1-dehydrogenase
MRTLGRTGVRLTQLGFGGAPIGELYRKVEEDEALAAIRAAWNAGIRFFDTAPWYGRGLSELRMGAGLRGHHRHEFILSTKVGRWLKACQDPNYSTAPWVGGLAFEVVFDYSYDGIMRSFEQSQLRVGVAQFDLLTVHDLDPVFHGTGLRLEGYFCQLATSGWRALEELKASGLVRAVGVGVNVRGSIPRFLDLFDFEYFLVAMPYTLLDQDVLDDEFPACVARGVGIIIGSPFASGLLASRPVEGARYAYRPVDPPILDRARKVAAVCERHAVPLAAAALQFPLGHPAVACVIVGASQPGHVERSVAAFRHSIPSDLWVELKQESLLHPEAPVPT